MSLRTLRKVPEKAHSSALTKRSARKSDAFAFHCDVTRPPARKSSFGASAAKRTRERKKNEEGELDGCGVDEVDFRPGSSKPVRNGFKVKVLSPFPINTNEDGSLPSSPDSPSSRRARLRGAAPGRAVRAGNQGARIITWLSVGQEMEVGFVTDVAESLFSDGTTNWGRVVSLVTFGAVVARHLKQSGLEHCIEPLGERISSFLLRDERAWMIENGAWEGFVDFFHMEDPESSVRNASMTFAGLAGIDAGIVLLMR
ncbi:induced myeloid leukemia cell differentiation protein Mcl-1-like [Acipenser ruthenus]|uniref:induced myeloid leukemia cell differentiation protein Mcl-1-like n=1 Tax=Acipenser ruthenus TaxID=7906 RepID=UPI002740F134|nr:induced myeloid leukemia cell differentiation protein Mcl-1-like [Acipenser ruthenus]